MAFEASKMNLHKDGYPFDKQNMSPKLGGWLT